MKPPNEIPWYHSETISGLAGYIGMTILAVGVLGGIALIIYAAK